MHTCTHAYMHTARRICLLLRYMRVFMCARVCANMYVCIVGCYVLNVRCGSIFGQYAKVCTYIYVCLCVNICMCALLAVMFLTCVIGAYSVVKRMQDMPYAKVCTCTHACMYVCIYVYGFVSLCMQTYMYMKTLTCMHTCVFWSNVSGYALC
jgi:hypothetical protein